MKFVTKKCALLTHSEIGQCSDLFSNNYGYYSEYAPERAGNRIKLGFGYYRDLQKQDDIYVSLAYHDNDIVGHAFYVLDEVADGYVSWVIQLVVDKEFRRRSIAKKLLFSVWGFSNDVAWGLATTNPLTIKTLESATLRRVSFSAMQKNIGVVEKLSEKVKFADKEKIDIDFDNATVDTGFYVDHRSIGEKIKAYGDRWIYGDLDEGKEWLAFIFQDQEVHLTSEKLNELLESSSKNLVDAYSRMKIGDHQWAKGTSNEVDFIAQHFEDKNKSIIDFGCGIGRHLSDLDSRGYRNIFGIDFSENHIKYCKNEHIQLADKFEVYDCRYYCAVEKFDYALCLYDVIGSFPDNNENTKILNQLYLSLRVGGIAIVSVMNMELTKKIAKHHIDVYKTPELLFKLKASQTMQSTGNIFDPDYFMIDEQTNIVYRKEKFINDGGLSAEYIVRDRRYSEEEIVKMAKNVGFKIIESRFVRAGDWFNPRVNIDPSAKEILLVLEKPFVN